MATLRLKGFITEDRQLKVDLPDDVPMGEVEIIIEVDEPISDEELKELMTFKPATGAEIAEMLESEDGWWEDLGITDGVDWVNEQRRKRRFQW